MVRDGFPCAGGLDGGGNCYSANLLGSSVVFNATSLTLGAANVPNAVTSTIVGLPVGQFSSMTLLATGVNGNQPSQRLTVNYTDGTSTPFSQSFSDWHTPQNYAGEGVASTMAYRDSNSGTEDPRMFDLYGYSLALNAAKTVQSVTLPANSNVLVLAITLIPASHRAAGGDGLSLAYNRMGMVTDGFPCSGGLDGANYCYSANLLGSTVVFNGTSIALGPANVPNAVSNATVALSAGQFSSMTLLATGVNGNQFSQSLTVNYTDGTSTPFVQSFSDWFTPQNFPGEGIAATMAYRDTGFGTEDNRTFFLYGYSFTLNGAKTVQSVTLPANSNVLVLAMTLIPASTTVSGTVNLTSASNRLGMVSDGFPCSSGLDGFGYCYSANLLGSTVVFNGTSLTLGAANVPNAVTSATVALPGGQFSSMTLLATGVNGNQPSQTLTVNYTDGTSTPFGQSFSDWFSPQSYPGEGVAASMAYRDTMYGAEDNRTFFLYGYSFTLNGAKTVQSVTLPANSNVLVLAITLTTGSSSPTYSISGTVTNAGATVTLSGSSSAVTGTNASGAYTFSGLSNGSYVVTPSNAGYTFTPAVASVSINNSSVTGVNFTAVSGIPSTYSISGTVTNSGATLTLSGSSSAVTSTNGSGGYTFSGLSNGSYVVAPSNPGYTFTPAIASVSINNSSVTGVSFTASAVQHSVLVSWDASATPNITGYNLYRSTASGGPYAILNPAIIGATSYVDSNVTAGATYYYVATTVQGSNESSYSNQTQAVIPTP